MYHTTQLKRRRSLKDNYICLIIINDDYYQLLELDKNASASIKKAYRKLALKYHPDLKIKILVAQNLKIISSL